MFRVTIREIHCEEKFGPSIEISAKNATQCLVATPNSPPGRMTHQIVAAEGWAKAVGIARKAFMTRNGAPGNLIENCTVASGILRTGQLQVAPQFLFGLAPENGTQWLLDNSVQSWLISVEPVVVHANPSPP